MTRFAQALVTAFLASIAFPFFVAAAEPKTAGGRIGIGDLVEYTTGMGPMLGEVINGPDASNYYLLLVPSAGASVGCATRTRTYSLVFFSDRVRINTPIPFDVCTMKPSISVRDAHPTPANDR